jgi:hypothetical protein
MAPTFSVDGGNVVFDQDGDTVERTARTKESTLLIENLGLEYSRGIDLDNRMEGCPLMINFLDPLEVSLHKVRRRKVAGGESSLEFSDTSLVQVWQDFFFSVRTKLQLVERWRYWGPCCADKVQNSEKNGECRDVHGGTEDCRPRPSSETTRRQWGCSI